MAMKSLPVTPKFDPEKSTRKFDQQNGYESGHNRDRFRNCFSRVSGGWILAIWRLLERIFSIWASWSGLGVDFRYFELLRQGFYPSWASRAGLGMEFRFFWTSQGWFLTVLSFPDQSGDGFSLFLISKAWVLSILNFPGRSWAGRCTEGCTFQVSWWGFM